MTRRELLSLTAGAALAFPVERTAAQAKLAFDPDFGSALDAAAAIRERKISSLELTQHVLRRIDKFEPKLNAYAYEMREEALAAARRADQAVAAKAKLGPLHGVPINVKESFAVAGRPCTWGIPELKNSRAPAHSAAVRRLLDAGTVLLGATNVPRDLADWQSYNEIYGTTNNPWDITRTPGGSSGGTAASLAAGMTFFSIGSDIGGSIRVPAAWCGIYGHKPTLDIVSEQGHAPGGGANPPGFSTLLAAAGPMARTAADLAMGLQILAGPEPPATKAWRWAPPKPRHERLRDFRIGYVLEDPSARVSAETKTVLETAVHACEKAGATMKAGWPAGFNLPELIETYLFLLGAFIFSVMPPPQRAQERGAMAKRTDPIARGSLAGFADWQNRNFARLAFRARWEKYFESVDVCLLPAAFTTAPAHDHSAGMDARTLALPEGGSVPWMNVMNYIAPATLTGCPATIAPAGLSKSGLPVGIQILGPYLEDATPIEFARLLAREIGGFRAPKGYVAP